MDTWDPKQYEKFKNERAQPFRDLMALLQPVPDGEVVDLGCGTGELTKELHHYAHARSTTGIDHSPSMLEAASFLAGDGLKFQQADITDWEPSKPVDIVFSNAALQWCPSHRVLFSRLTQWLEASGQLAIQMPMNHDYPTHVLAKKMSHEEPWLSRLAAPYDKDRSLLKAEEYAVLMHELRYMSVSVSVKVYGHILDSRQEVIEWVKGTLLTYFRGQLGDAHYEEFLSEFRRRLFEQLPDARPFYYPFKRILIWGRL